jgi:hypothetical protein
MTPLFLQVKEATASVLEAFLPKDLMRTAGRSRPEEAASAS